MSFRSNAIAFIRTRAAELSGSRDFDIHFAAYLFAIASQLASHYGNPRMLVCREDLQSPSTREDLFDQLTELAEDLDASNLFWTLIGALLTIEALVCRQSKLSYRTALPASTLLMNFPAGEYRGLSGRVLHWIRPTSFLTKERHRRFDEATNPPPDPAPHPGTYLKELAMYWDSDPQLPGVVPVKPSFRLTPLFEQSGPEAQRRRRFRVALCPLPGEFHPLFRIMPDGCHFQALAENGMVERDRLYEHLEAVVEAAVAERVNLLILPELSIDEDTRVFLKRILQKTLNTGGDPVHGIVAGSFHIWRTEGPGGELLPVNETILLDPAGEVKSRHWKKGRFRITSRDVRAAPHFYAEPPKHLEKEIFEDIRYGSDVAVLDTSLGRLVLLICADAIAADEKGYLSVIGHLRPDLLLVVSMTPETQYFDAFAEAMSRFWIGSLFVNAHCVCRKPAPRGLFQCLQRAGVRLTESVRDRLGLRSATPNLVACDLALFEAKDSPPTRMRWRYGRGEPECIYYHPADRNRNWRPLSRALGETGISWLGRAKVKLGVVVDLGAHFTKTASEGKDPS